MHQIKIFKAVESDIAAMEREVNNWLRETGVRVINITGNIAPQTIAEEGGAGLGKSAYPPSDVILIVLYED